LQHNKWKLTKDKCKIVKGSFDEKSGNYWWRVMIYTPELHLETQDLFTKEYAINFIDSITQD